MAATRVTVPAVRSGSRCWSANGQRPFRTGVLIATFRCEASARAARSPMNGASWPATRAAECTASVHVFGRVVRRGRSRGGARTDDGFSPGGSSPPSVTLRPHVAARSPIRGASWWATMAARCTDEPGRPWSRRSPRTYRFARWSWRLHLGTRVFIATFGWMRPRAAARSPMSGASWRRKRRLCADAEGSGRP